jgi:hypothetical protein
LIGSDGGLIVLGQEPFLSPHPFLEDLMNRRKLSIDDFAVETFETGIDPMEVTTKASSGNGCTVLTTCSPDCCDTTAAIGD